MLKIGPSTFLEAEDEDDSEHTRDYTKLFPVCKVEILQGTVNTVEVLSSIRLISADFRFSAKSAKKS